MLILVIVICTLGLIECQQRYAIASALNENLLINLDAAPDGLRRPERQLGALDVRAAIAAARECRSNRLSMDRLTGLQLDKWKTFATVDLLDLSS